MNWILAVLALILSIPGFYLGMLAILSFLPPRSTAGHSSGRELRLVVLVPAHDEQSVIGGTVRSLRELTQHEGVPIHVVADNCVDRTADAARLRGACVHERTSATHGKGAALNWLVRDVLLEDPTVDAFVLVDADTRLSTGFFRAVRETLSGGAVAVQGLNLVDTSRGGALTWMREIIFRLACHVRPLAYASLGTSAGLHGNGVCVRADIARLWGWDERSVAEDVDLHLRLAMDGHRVTLATGAEARSLMPERLDRAYAQTVRWERGKLDLWRGAARLLAKGFARRDLNMVTSAFDVLLPPYTVVVLLAVVALGIGALASERAAVWPGASACVGVLAYLARGIQLARPPHRELVAAAALLPRYVAWKLRLLTAVAAGAGRGVWTRTERHQTTALVTGSLVGSEVES